MRLDQNASPPCGTSWLGAALLLLLAAGPASGSEIPIPTAMQEIEVRAGKWQDVFLQLGVDNRPDLVFDVRLERPGDPGLELGIWDDGSRRRVSRSTLRHTPGGRTLWLRVRADHGTAREVRARVLVTTVENAGEGRKVRRTIIPLRFAVHPEAAWVEAHPGRWLGAVAAAALIFFSWSSVAHSRFLLPGRLAERLQPLRWNARGETEVYAGSRQAVEGRIADQLQWRDRALNWLRANPLVFGLPGKTYEETVRISLDRRVEHLYLELIPRRDARHHLERHPELQAGYLFASAAAGNQVHLFGRPDGSGRLGRLRQKEGSTRDRIENRYEVELRESPPRTDGPAGWRILPARAAAGRRRAWARLRWESGR